MADSGDVAGSATVGTSRLSPLQTVLEHSIMRLETIERRLMTLRSSLYGAGGSEPSMGNKINPTPVPPPNIEGLANSLANHIDAIYEVLNTLD